MKGIFNFTSSLQEDDKKKNKTKSTKPKSKSKSNMNHQMVIRHFKTHHNRINYPQSYKEAIPYINFIKKYMEKFSLKEIVIKTSPIERTLMTSLILYIKLKELDIYDINKPIIDKNLERDPTKEKKDNIINHYKKNYDSGEKLVINVTHSSVYSNLFVGLMSGMNEADIKLKDISDEKRIHAHSLSFLTDYKDEVKYGFNILME